MSSHLSSFPTLRCAHWPVFLIEGHEERLRKEKAHLVCISHTVKQCVLLRGVGAEGPELPLCLGPGTPGQAAWGRTALSRQRHCRPPGLSGWAELSFSHWNGNDFLPPVCLLDLWRIGLGFHHITTSLSDSPSLLPSQVPPLMSSANTHSSKAQPPSSSLTFPSASGAVSFQYLPVPSSPDDTDFPCAPGLLPTLWLRLSPWSLQITYFHSFNMPGSALPHGPKSSCQMLSSPLPSSRTISL